MTGRLPRFAAGDVFAERYVIIEEIGIGGMGEVYKATDRILAQPVALKLLRTDVASKAVGVERFKREIQLARQVSHPNVCRMHDIGEVNGIRFISMEHVDGQTLHHLIRSMGRLSPRQTVTLARQIAEGLDAIHESGIVHRDLKPTNIMLDRSGRAVLMDFGLALGQDADSITAAGEVLGTLSYLSPEQAQGNAVDARSDLYGLGLILFEMLTGVRPPGDGERTPLALRRTPTCPRPSSLTPEVPKELDEIVLRCLEGSPQKRYASAAALDVELARVQDFSSSANLKAQPPARPWVWLAGVAAVVLATSLWIVFAPDRPPSSPPTLALLPLDFEGPEEADYLRSLVPLFLGDELRESRFLDVAPFASSRAFPTDEAPVSVAAQLGVDYVLTGTLTYSQRSPDEITTTLELIGVDGETEWKGEFASDVSSVQGTLVRVAADIRNALGVRAQPSRIERQRSAESLALYTRGLMYLEGWDVDQNYQRAASSFRDALGRDPEFAEAEAGLSMALWSAYLETREPALVGEAERLANHAVENAPSLPEAHLARGIVRLGQGRSAEAAESLGKAQELAPGNDDVSRRIATAYERLSRLDEAESMYLRAIELRPSYWRHVNDLGAFYWRHGRIEEAKERFRETIHLNPERHTGYANLAGAHLLAGEIDEAEPLLQAAIRIRPSASAHNNLGFVYYSTGRFEEAVQQYRRAVELAPAVAMYHGNLGDAYRQLKRRDDSKRAYLRAIEMFEATLAVNSEDWEARAGLAMFLAGAGRCDDAGREARIVAGDSPGIPSAQYYAAIAHSVCGNDEEAVRAAAAAVEGGAVADVETNPDLKRLLGREPLAGLLR